MNGRTMFAAAALGAFALAAAGCHKGGKVGAREFKQGDTLTIAMIAKSSTNPVFLASRTGAEAAADSLSRQYHITIRVNWLTPPQEDGQVQAQRIQQAVNDGVDAILISCSDAGKVTGAINDAVGRGVQVMTFDSDAPESQRFAFYGVDDKQAGAQTMAELVTLLGGHGRVAILAGNQNAPNLRQRVMGAQEEAAKHPDIHIVGVFNHIETPQDAAAEVIRVDNAYPDLQGWAFIGGWPLWTQTLLTDIDPRRLKVASIDALPAQLVYVDRGIVPVLLAQSMYLWGYVGVQTIVDKVYLKHDVHSVPPMQLVRVTKVTLGDWSRTLKSWGFDVPLEYLDRH